MPDVVVTSSSLNIDLALNRETSLTTFAEPIDLLFSMQASTECGEGEVGLAGGDCDDAGYRGANSWIQRAFGRL